MTEQKRFINNGSMIFENKPSLREPLNTFEIVNLLNELYEENEELKKENNQLKAKNEQLKNKKNYLHNKPPIWHTQSIKLTDKEYEKVAEAIDQSLKERRKEE